MAITNIFKRSQKSPPKVSPAEGQDYIVSSFNFLTPWDTQNLTVSDIDRFKDHWVSYLVRESIKNMIFQGDLVINCLENGKSREDLADIVRKTADKIDLLALMKQQYDDYSDYGTFLRSVGWKKSGNEVTLEEVLCLPPNTFKSTGRYATSNYVYGQILKGIMKNKEGEIEYWQERAYQMNQVQLKNCEHFKSPISSYYLDGVPLLNPLYQLLPDLNVAKAGLMQANKRANILFVRDNSTQIDMPDGKGTRWSYIHKMLRQVSNNIWFALAKDMEPIELKGQVSNISVDTIYLLVKLILMCYSPASFLSMGETNRLGGSTAGETTLMKASVLQIQSNLKKTWEPVFEKLLEYNYYPGIKVQILMPQIKEENDQLNFQIASKIIDAVGQYGLVIGEINEIREKCGWEDISEEALNKARESWEAVRITQSSVKEMGSVEPQNNTNLKEINMTQNQSSIKTRAQIESDTKDELYNAISKSFEDLKQLRM